MFLLGPILLRMSFWRAMFALAALFNLGVGGAMLVDPDHAFALMGMPRPIVDLLPVAVTGWLIACFGFAYALVALRPERNTDLVRFAILGKLGVAALVVAAWLDGRASSAAALLVAGDLFWVFLFALFLLSRRLSRPLD